MRGKVVLIDFWAYSCINCQRAIPHVVGLVRRLQGQRARGHRRPLPGVRLREGRRQRRQPAPQKLGIDYPVALDNKLSTWTNYRNRYWPAHYLIDAQGTVRHIKFGEGDYEQTEEFIRALLRQADPKVQLPQKTGQQDADLTSDRTPETYLSNLRIRGYTGDPLVDDKATVYRMPPAIPLNRLSLGGTWTAGYEYFTAGPDARLAFTYKAKNVNVVLAGEGRVDVVLDGKVTRTLTVSGAPTLYRLVDEDSAREATVEIRPAAGIQAYSFTFG